MKLKASKRSRGATSPRRKLARVGSMRLLGIRDELRLPDCEIVTVLDADETSVRLDLGYSVFARNMPGAKIGQKWLIINEKDSPFAFGEVRATWLLSMPNEKAERPAT